jgi:hypothetical protein
MSIGEPLSVNVTDPDGVPSPAPTGLTVAVNVTGPWNAGFADEVTDVVVAAAPVTVWISGDEDDDAKVPSPEYVAVIESDPCGSAVVVICTVTGPDGPPAGIVCGTPIGVVPLSKNDTDPVGAPAPAAPGLTVALIVTDDPSPDGFGTEATDVVVVTSAAAEPANTTNHSAAVNVDTPKRHQPRGRPRIQQRAASKAPKALI